MKKLFLLLLTVFSISMYASAQSQTITGTVTDAANGDPLIGASITPAGATGGAVTDVDGNFKLVVDSKVKELTVSYVGYTTKTVKVAPKLNISLSPSSEMLETVVVTGYGSGKKLGSITGSVSVVGEAALENVTTPSFVDALQGQVAGLSVMSNSGDPSSVENEIRIRGVNSIFSGTTPLFILDGAPITQTVFSTLNPNDIESITVLKDAASVAIYGSRAANGVIVITSKRGKYAEQAHVTVRGKFGWSQMVSDQVEMMNSEQYIQYRNIIGSPVTSEMVYAWDKLGINTDWRNETFSSNAPTYSLEGMINGGSENFNYYLSVNHMDMQGIIAQSDMRRETIRVSLSSRVREWLRIGFQANLGYTKYQTNNESNGGYSGQGVYLTNPMVFARVALPLDSPNYWWAQDANGDRILPSEVDWNTYDGAIGWGERAKYLHFTGLASPEYNDLNRKVWRNRVTVNANLFEEIRPVKGLLLRAQQAVDAYDSRLNNTGWAHDFLETPMGDIYEQGSANANGIVEGYNQQSFSRYYQFTYTNTAEYTTKFNAQHNLTLMIGEESIISKSESFGVFTQGQPSPKQYLLGQGTAVSMSDVSQGVSQVVMNSIFANASYNFEDRYFVDVNFRRDGSSRFAPGHQWSNFFSVGVMWDAKQEKFLAPVTWLNALKVRASYGTTGNSSFANYGYFGLMGSGPNYNGNPSMGVSQAPNPDLSWETVRGTDVGVNAGFINVFNIDVDFYNKETVDMLMSIPYSMTTGIGGGWGNVGTMLNRGVDVDVKAKVFQNKDWYFDLRANFNYNYNEILSLYDDIDELPFPDYGFILQKGKPSQTFYMVKYAGVDPRDGQQMWYTREGNLTKVYNEERDSQAIDGKTQFAPLSGGFGTSLSYKGISLRADFTWAAKKYMINNDLYFIQNNNFGTSYNQTTKMLDTWVTPGQITDIPAIGQEYQFDTRFLEDASFVRLKTLTLQYSFPKKLIAKARLTDLKLHFTGRNLLTFTNYTGYDPEPETNVVKFFYPNTRQFELGIDVSF